MSIHPLVLATLENLRTHAELQAETLRSRRKSTSSDLPHATAIGRRLREADAIAGSWLRVLAAVNAAPAEPCDCHPHRAEGGTYSHAAGCPEADAQQMAAEELEDGGVCELAECGRDLLA